MKKLILRYASFVAITLITTATLPSLYGHARAKKGHSRAAKVTLQAPPKRSIEVLSVTSEPPAEDKSARKLIRSSKPWTLLVYIAANNNLHTFALQNMRQMLRVGSNDNINIVVQFDGIGDRKIKRYLIESNQARVLEALEPEGDTISGTPHSLYQFIKWGYQTFPAEHVAIDLWNHGSGIKDPSIWGKFLMSHRDDLFGINPETRLLELNRRMDTNAEEEESEFDNAFNQETRTLFADLTLALMKKRGIAFNDADEVYIDNQQLRLVLDNVCRYVLVDKPIDIVLMDACHMAMVELASKIRPYSRFMVGSSEVEPGSGYDYNLLLAPFASQALTPKEFATHAVRAYEKQYRLMHADFTQSAVDLALFAPVEKAFTTLAKTLYDALGQTDPRRVFELIRTIRLSSKNTTEFYDPDYIDAGHFLTSLLCKTRELLASGENFGTEAQASLEKIIVVSEEAYRALTTSIVAETHGSNIPMSHGLGLFFPKRNIHSSYLKTSFDKTTGWSLFLARFLNRLKYGRPSSVERASAL